MVPDKTFHDWRSNTLRSKRKAFPFETLYRTRNTGFAAGHVNPLEETCNTETH